MQSATRGPERKDMSGEIVLALEKNERPVMGTGELAEEFDLSTPAMKKHLERAHEMGAVKHDKIGNYNVWWVEPVADGGTVIDWIPFLKRAERAEGALTHVTSLRNRYSKRFYIMLGVVMTGSAFLAADALGVIHLPRMSIYFLFIVTFALVLATGMYFEKDVVDDHFDSDSLDEEDDR